MSYYSPINSETLNLADFGLTGEFTHVRSTHEFLSMDGEVIYFDVDDRHFVAFVDDYTDLAEITQCIRTLRKEMHNVVSVQLLKPNTRSTVDEYQSTEESHGNPLYIAEITYADTK